MFDIKEELKKLPDSPGVYIMHDKADNIIYVGKAVNLKRRVSSYFQTRPRSPKIEKMISLIDHFEYIMVESEMEAFVLECNLIKENRPKYNTMLMDDKTYPFVKITLFEKYPKITLTRHHEKDGAKYYGPYTNVTALKEILKMFRKLYGYRTCNKKLDGQSVERPCLYHQVGECMGPCSGNVDPEEYRKGIDEIAGFFEGDSSSVKKNLKEKMLKCSENMEFEQAAAYRDMLQNVEELSQTQRVTAGFEMNRDVIGIALKDYKAVVQIFFIRSGKMVGREHYLLEAESDDKKEVLTEFVKQFYGGTALIPKEILLSEEIEEKELVTGWLSDVAGRKVTLTTPQKGKKEKLVELAVSNAENLLNKDAEKLLREAERTTGAIEELGELLCIEAPVRIESYDISNTAGYESVGSMVVYENGKPKKSDYRRFKIKTVEGPDDYASMREVLSRRFMRAKDQYREKDSFTKLPDLILMDGGRGQVNAALEITEKLGFNIMICGMVKDDHHRTRGLYFENEELPIDTGSECFKLITRIQDETHRFAIEYHKSLRSKGQVRSILDDIEGIGATRRRSLITHFETITAIKEADVDTLSKAPGMNIKAAQAVYDFFHGTKPPVEE
ncbi:MAG: excinuclease ABC subunit UvrC [Lachnospiraceae bacterium]|nr:excinuclease ABC subunit UvrC [Lachnospiraceae bacterium]MBR3580113.1 excinuclease ABC subunit UvrC [Lachnospiraceae bacterium]MBR4541480.1 excinuclease ABC subunit UvrC [Lachnospiraceae bacterium]